MADTHQHDGVHDGTDAPGPKNALGVPNFRFLWLNSVTFFLAFNALRFVYGWVVLDGLNADGQLDNAAFWQSLVVFMLGVPSFFLLLPSGVMADRVDPKRMLVATQASMLVVMVATALAMGSGAGSLPLLIISALCAGAAGSMGGPVRSSLIPLVLPERLLYSGIALNAIAMTLSLVFGAITARAFGNLFGFDGAFWYMTVLLVAGLIALNRLRSPGPATKGNTTTMRQAMGEGIKFVWNERGIRVLFVLLSVSGAIMTPIMFVTILAHLKDELGRDAADGAYTILAMGIGLLITSAFVMRQGDMANKSVLFMRAMVGGCTCQILMGQANHFWQVLVLSLLMGMCGGFFITMNQGLIQGNTPPDKMGRVMSLYALVQAGFTPVGALVLGVAASAIGTGLTISIGAAIGLITVLIIYMTSTSIREIN